MNTSPVLDRLEDKYNESTPAWRDTETGQLFKDAIDEIRRLHMITVALAEQTPRTVVIPKLNLKQKEDIAVQTNIHAHKADASSQVTLLDFVRQKAELKPIEPDVKSTSVNQQTKFLPPQHSQPERPKRPMNLQGYTQPTVTNIQNVRYYTQTNNSYMVRR